MFLAHHLSPRFLQIFAIKEAVFASVPLRLQRKGTEYEPL